MQLAERLTPLWLRLRASPPARPARGLLARALGGARAARPRPVARPPGARPHRPPQLVALLPGRRPDLLLHRCLVVRALDAADRRDRLGLALRPDPGRRRRGRERARGPARRRAARHRRPAARRPARRVRDRRAHRRPALRLLGGGALDRRPVPGDPALRAALPRQVRRADAAADLRHDPARGLPLDGPPARRRLPGAACAGHRRLARARARRARARLRLLREAVERRLLRPGRARVPARPPLARARDRRRGARARPCF